MDEEGAAGPLAKQGGPQRAKLNAACKLASRSSSPAVVEGPRRPGGAQPRDVDLSRPQPGLSGEHRQVGRPHRVALQVGTCMNLLGTV